MTSITQCLPFRNSQVLDNIAIHERFQEMGKKSRSITNAVEFIKNTDESFTVFSLPGTDLIAKASLTELLLSRGGLDDATE